MLRHTKVAALVALLAVAGLIGMKQMPRAAAAPANDHAAHGSTATHQIEQMAAAGSIHANHALDEIRWAAYARQAAPASSSLPADDMGAVDRLAKSPRKGEYVTINVGTTPMRAWVVRPQGTAPAPVVIVIQEIFGLSDWIRAVADQLAADGFIAVAPDLLSGMGPNGGDSSSIGQQELMKTTLSLPPAEVITRLKAVREWGVKQKGSNGKSATVGFCFGGSQSFAMAIAEPSLNAAVVYYGDAPNANAAGGRGAPFAAADSLASIKAPVLGLYGGLKEDARIGVTIEPTRMKMKELGKTYDVHIFDGAAHGFLRAQTGNNGANMKATQQAWPLTVAWLRRYAG